MRNAADPKQVKRAGRRDKERAKRAEADLRWVLSDPRGRRFLWQLLGDSGIFRTSFTGNSETFFREGMRNLGLQVFTRIHEVAPDLYLEMAQEAQAEQKADADADALAAGVDQNEDRDDG